MSNRSHRRGGARDTHPLRGFENPGPPNFGLPASSPFTVEGQIERETMLLAGAKRAHGWRKWVVYGFFGVWGIVFVAGVIAAAVSALF